ncbi:MAG: T9SS type A sorting domain-containing protein [Ignavibacteriaceae bacterium]|nr:T9SS type A sorting domain-containing protein [Ignavibacteriaceae bacterium]
MCIIKTILSPFNPARRLFRLAVDSKLAKIFDVLGQEIATLVNTNLAAGAHNINFDASSLNSGVYLYRIEATGINGTNLVDVKKMILTIELIKN